MSQICNSYDIGLKNFWALPWMVVLQLLSHVRLFATLWTAACQAPLSSAVSQSLLKFMSLQTHLLIQDDFDIIITEYNYIKTI